MTDQAPVSSGYSLEEFWTAVIGRRRLVAVLAVVGAALSLALGVLGPARFTTRATVIAVAAGGAGDARVRGLASQLGLGELAGLTGRGQAASPEFLIQLALSPMVMQRLVRDSVRVSAESPLQPLVDVISPLKGDEPLGPAQQELRVRRAAHNLRTWIKVWQIRETASVRVEVTTRWPDVSQALARGLLRALNQANLEIGRGQAQEERRFIEARLAERERLARDAEGRLAAFLRENREFRNSASLMFEHDRLQREVSLQQQLLGSVAQSLEDVRIREVRDVSVISVVEPPQYPLERDPRRLAFRGLAGIVGGLLVAMVLVVYGLVRADYRRPASMQTTARS